MTSDVFSPETDCGLNHLSSSQELTLSQMMRSSKRQKDECKLPEDIILSVMRACEYVTDFLFHFYERKCFKDEESLIP